MCSVLFFYFLLVVSSCLESLASFEEDISFVINIWHFWRSICIFLCFSAIVMILFCFYDLSFCELIPSTFGFELSVRWYPYGLMPIQYFST